MYLSPSTFSILICSLPILEDLYLGSLGIKGGNGGVVIRPSTSPPLTGTLSLSLPDGMECTTPFNRPAYLRSYSETGLHVVVLAGLSVDNGFDRAVF